MPTRRLQPLLAAVESMESRLMMSFTPYKSGSWTATPSYAYLNRSTGKASTAKPLGSTTPNGAPLTPASMRAAYGLGPVGASNVTFNGIQGDGTGQTIAIVDVGSDPTIQTDLSAFDSYYNIPDPPSFQQLSQTGSTTGLPGPVPGWIGEISLDVEWSHVMAPGANMILFAASDLYAAVQEAASYPGVAVISMSFGISGNAPDQIFVTPSGHTGVSFYAGSGDTGSQISSPAQAQNVVAVGGTHLNLNGSSGYGSESAWSAGGGGVSFSESQPAYQKGIVSAYTTSQRALPDVAMDGDPGSGVAIYSATDGGASTPWELIIGGTSLSTPLFAGVVAVADQGRVDAGLTAMDGGTQVLPRLYQLSQANSANFHDVTTGSNGHPAGPGYDLATGLGSAVANLLIPDLAGADNISGRAFVDANGNGTFDAGDTAFANRTVYLDLNNNGYQDPTDPTTTTDANGMYSFTDQIGSFTGVVRLSGTFGFRPESAATLTTAYNTSQTFNLAFVNATYTATATPNPVTSKTTTLGVTATGTAVTGQTYTWAATTSPPGAAPGFSVNGTTSAASPTVTFDKVGNYTLTVKITDPLGRVSSSTVAVTVVGLAAYYKMNEGSGSTTADVSGNGNTATLNNTTWTTGVAGAGLAFDGSTSEVTVPPLNLDTNTVTMSGWVYSNGSQSGYTGLIFNRDGANGNGLDVRTGSELGYTWGQSSSSNYDSGLNLPTHVWTFIALVTTATNATLYMEPLGGAMSQVTNPLVNDIESFGGNIQLGQDAYSAGRTFNGSMDEVRIYNTSLTTATVTALASSNSFLTAVNDTVTASAGSPGTVNVLANDSGANGSALSVASFTQPAKGTVTSDNAGNLTYTTTATIAGTDSFTYTITDGTNTSTATVNVSIQGLVANYKLNEGTGTTTADATGNGHTGTLNNATWTTGIASSPGLAFDGSSGFVSLPALNLNANTVTITGWIKPTGNQSGYAGVVFNRDGGNGNGINFYSDGKTLGYTWADVGGTSGWNSGLVPVAGVWNFVAVVITPTNATLYLQPAGGAMQSAINNVANTAQSFAGTTQIGQDAYSSGRTFSGSIDAVQIYNLALSPTAVAAVASNIALAAVADTATVAAGSTAAIAVLTNDTSSSPSSALSITSFTQGTKGTVTAGTNGNLIYTSTAIFAGTDTFTYTITDGTGTSTATVTVTIQGLDADYELNENTGTTTADATGNGYTGTLHNTTWTTGIANTGGLAFNGTSSYVSLPALNLNTNTATFTGWIKPAAAEAQYAGIVFNRDGGNGNGLNYFPDGKTLGYTWGNVAGTSGWNSGLVPTAGVWNFVAVVITPTNATLYLQPAGGAMQTAVNTVANVPQSFSGATQIGQDAYSTNRSYTGSIDSVHIYNLALTPTAIAAISTTPPTVATAATASPNPVTTTKTTLSVLGASSAGESTLTYSWSPLSIPSGAAIPTFSANGTNAAKTTTATFSAAGTYVFQVAITDGLNQTVTSTVTVTVSQTLTITVSAAAASVLDGQTDQFTAVAKDQFGIAATTPTYTWTLDTGGVGTVSSTGLYTAPASGGGSAAVRATVGTFSGAAVVTVIPSVINTTVGNDTVHLLRSGSNVLVYVNSTTTYSIPYAALNTLTLSTLAGDDTINVDFSGGSPVPPRRTLPRRRCRHRHAHPHRHHLRRHRICRRHRHHFRRLDHQLRQPRSNHPQRQRRSRHAHPNRPTRQRRDFGFQRHHQRRPLRRRCPDHQRRLLPLHRPRCRHGHQPFPAFVPLDRRRRYRVRRHRRLDHRSMGSHDQRAFAPSRCDARPRRQRSDRPQRHRDSRRPNPRRPHRRREVRPNPRPHLDRHRPDLHRHHTLNHSRCCPRRRHRFPQTIRPIHRRARQIHLRRRRQPRRLRRRQRLHPHRQRLQPTPHRLFQRRLQLRRHHRRLRLLLDRQRLQHPNRLPRRPDRNACQGRDQARRDRHLHRVQLGQPDRDRHDIATEEKRRARRAIVRPECRTRLW